MGGQDTKSCPSVQQMVKNPEQESTVENKQRVNVSSSSWNKAVPNLLKYPRYKWLRGIKQEWSVYG